MKISVFSHSNKLFFSAFLIALSMSLVSCGDDDDKVNCSKLEEQGMEASFDLLEAINNDDCEGIEDAYARSIKILKQAKSCDFVADLMEEYDVSTIEELEDEFTEQRDAYLEGAGCND
jgi:hypothetical protein